MDATASKVVRMYDKGILTLDEAVAALGELCWGQDEARALLTGGSEAVWALTR